MVKRTSSPNRRNFLKTLAGSAAGAILFSGTRLFGGTTCDQFGRCVSAVDFTEFAQEAYQQQQMPEWCWAACISMLFDFYGHAVSQDRIVTEVYGAPVNMPAGYGITIARQLNRVWKDDSGNRFRAILTGAYDADARVNTLTNPMLIGELDGDHPMIIGAGSHAMVLTALQYQATPMGPNVVGGGVFDPWPGRGARGLSRAELFPVERGGSMRFVATARVQDL